MFQRLCKKWIKWVMNKKSVRLHVSIRCLGNHHVSKRTASSSRVLGHQSLPFLLWTQYPPFLPSCRHDRHDHRDLVNQDFRECQEDLLPLDSPTEIAGRRKMKQLRWREKKLTALFTPYIQTSVLPSESESNEPQEIKWRITPTRSTPESSFLLILGRKVEVWKQPGTFCVPFWFLFIREKRRPVSLQCNCSYFQCLQLFFLSSFRSTKEGSPGFL